MSSRLGTGTRTAAWLLGTVLLFALIAVVVHLGEEHEFLEVARASDPRWLVIAAALQIVTYACAGLVKTYLRKTPWTPPDTSDERSVRT